MKRIGKAILVLLVLFFLLAMVGLEGLLIAPGLLLVGWIGFLGQVVPRIQVNWDQLAVGVLGTVVCVGGFHATARWLRRSMVPDGAVWPWRWTLVSMTCTLLLFTSAIAVIGVVHQVTWLAKTDEPMLRRSFLRHPEQVAGYIRNDLMFVAAQRAGGSGVTRGDDLRRLLPRCVGRTGWADIRIVVLSGPGDRLAGLVIDLQDPGVRDHGFQAYRWEEPPGSFIPLRLRLEDLPAFVATIQAGGSLDTFKRE